MTLKKEKAIAISIMSSKDRKEKVLITMDESTKEMIDCLAKKLGTKTGTLCSIWISLIDPENQSLLEVIRNIKIEKEILRLSSTRNSLIGKLHRTSVLKELANMNSDDLKLLIKRIKQKNLKK